MSSSGGSKSSAKRAKKSKALDMVVPLIRRLPRAALEQLLIG